MDNQKIETQIKLDKFVPRHYQLPMCKAFEEQGYKKMIIVMPRRAGKDVVAWNLLIRQSLRRIGLYVYALPSAVQARRVLFDGMTMGGQKFLDFIPQELVKSVNIQQMKITLHNNSTIIFTGSENYDALRGTNPLGVVISEAAYTHPQFYPTIRPALVASDGFVIQISTPFGENHFHNMFEIAKANPKEWYSSFLTIQDTGHISQEQIQAEIESGEISPDMAEQEYYCSFGIGAIGAYYAKYLNRMELNNQVGPVDWEPNFPVHSAWDLRRERLYIYFDAPVHR